MGKAHGTLTAILQYFTDKVEDYWHILYPLTPVEEREKDPFLYFYDISGRALLYKGKFSDDGIYLFKGYDGKDHIFAAEIAQYALACWCANRVSKDDRWIEKALLHCNWLVENQYPDGSWRMKHKNPLYSDLPDPWPSAFCQGLAISSLIRGYRYTTNTLYLHAAQKACNFFTIDIKNNGVRRELPEGFILEEYPRKRISGVLNGYITAIFGIYELSKIDDSYSKAFTINIDNLKRILSLFDTDYWSFYSLDMNIVSGFYHRYVILQLKALEFFDSYFHYYYQKFSKYLRNWIFPFIALFFKIVFKFIEKYKRNRFLV